MQNSARKASDSFVDHNIDCYSRYKGISPTQVAIVFGKTGLDGIIRKFGDALVSHNQKWRNAYFDNFFKSRGVKIV